MPDPYCFVLMPFGTKVDATGIGIDFDAVYERIIERGIRLAEMRPIRGDFETVGGIIHKALFERLLLSEYAVADLSTANANVYYELGIRHAVRPFSTTLLFANGLRIPFDLGPARALRYQIDPASGALTDAEGDARRLRKALVEARQRQTDSPLFQLLGSMQAPDVSRLKTDTFRDRVDYSEQVKQRLAAARARGVDAIDQVRADLGDVADVEAGTAVDLLLSYRAVKAWDRMAAFVEEALSGPLAQTVLVREQYALALNRVGRGAEAERELTRLIEQHGPSSETYGLLGRVYKDRWAQHKDSGAPVALVQASLDRAVEAYLRGFETDHRDPYPGINAVTLMEVRDPPDPRRAALVQVVRYAARLRLIARTADYWDYATLLELEVLAGDEAEARKALAETTFRVREAFEPETTARNLRLIREAREARGEEVGWVAEIEATLASLSPST